MTNVLIDTEVFRSHGFDFARPEFIRLQQLVDDEKLRVLTTRVIDGEVRRQMTQESVDAQQAIRRVLKDHSVLRHSDKVPFHSLVAKDAITDLTAIRLKHWTDWLKACKVEVISANDIDVDPIIDAYFQTEPPFGSGGKKAEFPDAITLAAAVRWATDKGEDLFVISNDGDFEKFCERAAHLYHFGSLAKFLERFTEKYIADLVTETILNASGDMIEFAGTEFASFDFVLEDVTGQVERVDVQTISIEEVHVIEASDGQGVAEVTVSIDYVAHVDYEDPDSGIWDSEDQEMLFTEEVSDSIQDSDTAVFSVEFQYNEDDPSEVEITKVTPDKRTRYISLARDDN